MVSCGEKVSLARTHKQLFSFFCVTLLTTPLALRVVYEDYWELEAGLGSSVSASEMLAFNASITFGSNWVPVWASISLNAIS